MTHASSPVFFLLRLVVVTLGLQASFARADDYTDVAQLMRTGNYSEALARADQTLATHPKDAQLRFYKGVIQRELGKTSDAISTFIKLSEEFPELPEPLNNLAVLYASQGQFDKARAVLEQALRTNPSYAAAHENLGDIYGKLATQAYNRALQLEAPASAPATPPAAKLALLRDLYLPTSRIQKIVPAPTAPVVAVAGKPGTSPSPAPAPAPAQNMAQAAPKPANSSPQVASGQIVNATPAAKPAPTKPAPVVTPPPVVAAAPKVAPAPVANNAAENKEVEAAVHAWANAWSARDMKAYLGAYGREFVPPGGVSRASWEEERHKRIAGKANISVRLSDISVSVSGTKATARFRQDYKAGGLVASSRKSLELLKSGGRWSIVKEAISN